MTRPTEQTACPWATACEGPFQAKPMLDCALVSTGEIVMSRVFDCRSHAEACARDMTLMAVADRYPDRYFAVPLPIVSR